MFKVDSFFCLFVSMVDHAWCVRVARRSARPLLSGSSAHISTNGSCRRSLREPGGGLRQNEGQSRCLEAGSFPGSVADGAGLVGTALVVLLLAIVGVVNS